MGRVERARSLRLSGAVCEIISVSWNFSANWILTSMITAEALRGLQTASSGKVIHAYIPDWDHGAAVLTEREPSYFSVRIEILSPGGGNLTRLLKLVQVAAWESPVTDDP